ncbi:DUF4397 domain-containing protein [Pedobacter frigidisoli]|uniref:DUF4397 domain-containing protein n=1 Tax=Pedobacter frigidisoli TaxID=2530455 RepID=A0A4R0P2R0_9SPHI|nr:DUF4397 domain-containing protein [Pedobacter frigidisoli]TCD11103.1 DUF4397 domain-containing protein [Pedobacter frigidisoli]
MKHATNQLTSYILFMSIAISVFSCKKHNPDEVAIGEAKMKVVNAVQTEVNQDVYVDDTKLTTVALAFGETSNYIKIPSGNRSVSFKGSTNPTNAALNFTPSITYTTFLVSNRAGVREIVNYEDNLSNNEPTKAKIKLISLTSFFNTGINVSVQAGTQFVNNLAFKEASTYFTVEAGMNLRYTVVGSGIVKTLDGTNLEAGKIYTIWFSGTTSASLDAHIITDN